MVISDVENARIRIVLICDLPGKIREVRDDLGRSAVVYGVVTVTGSVDLLGDLEDVLSIRSPRMPTIVIVDYATCPTQLFDVITGVNALCAGAAVEYIVLDAPRNERLRAKLKVLGVTLHDTVWAAPVAAYSIN